MSQAADLLKAVAQAKAGIDRVFSRLGKTLDAADPVVRLLARRSGAAIGLSNAAALLARNGQAAEAGVLLERLLSAVADAKAAAGPGGRPAAEAALARDAAEGADAAAGRELEERLAALGFPPELCAAPPVLRRARRGATGQLPWGHRFEDGGAPPPGAEDLLRITASTMGHLLWALEAIWESKLSKTPATPPPRS